MSPQKSFFAALIISSLGIAQLPAVLPDGNSLSQLWAITPDSVPYMTSASNSERGLGYNPTTGHVILVSRSPAVSGLEIEVLDKLSGAKLGTLSTSGISGGLFPLSQIDVADDGAIYAANLTLNAGNTPYRIYRWENESATPTLVYAGDPGAGTNVRWGDSFRVRGAGNDTQIIAAAGLGNTNAAIFTTATGGASFTSTRLDITTIAPGWISLGLAFGQGNVFYGIRNGGPLAKVVFDPTTGTGMSVMNLGLFTPNNPASTISAIGINLRAGLLMGASTSFNAGNQQFAVAYQLGDSVPADQVPFQTQNADNIGVSGAVDWDEEDGIAFVLDTNNGMMAISIPEPSTLALLVAGFVILAHRNSKAG